MVQSTRSGQVDPSCRRILGYPRCAAGKNVGNLCWVCFKVYRARFRGAFPDVEALKAEFGKNGELYQMYKYWYDLALKCMIAGGFNCRITWGTEQQARSIITSTKRRTAIEDPNDEVLPLDVYKALSTVPTEILLDPALSPAVQRLPI